MAIIRTSEYHSAYIIPLGSVRLAIRPDEGSDRAETSSTRKEAGRHLEEETRIKKSIASILNLHILLQ